MHNASLVDEYVAPLIAGNRSACREFVFGQLALTEDPVRIYHELLWPAMDRVEKLYRADRINIAAEHMATRINRCIADQLQSRLPKAESNGRRILIACADGEPEELGAQMCADLFEARGWSVYFLGGGVPNDEILNLVGQLRPDILLIFGTQPGGVPGVRHLIEMIRDIGVSPTMNIMVSGGVFNRADGLWKEVNADLMAKTAIQAMEMAEKSEPRLPQPRTLGGTKKRRRRRRPVDSEAPAAVAE
jgi:methanogenic corrinoid protein MtbC1